MRVTPYDVLQRLRYADAANPTPAEQGFRQRFLVLYPDQEANILSYQDNPACKCGGDIMNRIIADQARFRTNVQGLYDTTDEITVVIPRPIVGDVYTIPNDDQSWRDWVNNAANEGLQYRGLSLVAVDNLLKIYVW